MFLMLLITIFTLFMLGQLTCYCFYMSSAVTLQSYFTDEDFFYGGTLADGSVGFNFAFGLVDDSGNAIPSIDNYASLRLRAYAYVSQNAEG